MTLISAGASPNTHSSRGLAPIHYLAILLAIDNANNDKYRDMIQTLVNQHHVNINKQSSEKHRLGIDTDYIHKTPMEYFLQALENSYYGDYKNGLVLIRAGADSRTTDSNSHTLMWHLYKKDDKKAAHELIDILKNNKQSSNTTMQKPK